ncbi:histone methyltransferase DOT1 [Sporobolomyces salmoneus]|uniref:histone methyltransferase DOT1 n=1 Tax=Sporobolomyces salmoneus TaxID=183962 RepID=UPI00316BF6F5
MFTNRRPPPKSPNGSIPLASTSSNSSTSTSTPASTSTGGMTLSDRIKTQVRARPVIQTKVQTVVKTITRQVVKPKQQPPPSSAGTQNGKGKGKAVVRGNGNGNASKVVQKKKQQKLATESLSSDDDSDSDSAPARKKSKPSTSTKRTKRSRSSSLSSSGGGNGYESSSSLSSADEDYFSGKLGNVKPKVVEGTPACVRNVASKEPLVEGTELKIVSSESVVRSNLGAYILDFFADPANPQATAKDWCGEDLPIFELEYPAEGARERFALLAPKRNDEYNPIEDLMVTIETILENYLTPAQALSHFGYTPGSSFSSFSSFLKPLHNQHRHQQQQDSASTSPASTSTSRSSSPAINHIGTPKLSTPEPSTIITSTSSTTSASATAPPILVVEPLLRSLEKARNRRDGPTFFSHLRQFNQTLLSLKPSIATTISAMPGLREKLWTKIFHQCYDRTVGPDIEELRKYAAFSDNVYGELLPKFMNEIFQKTGKVLGPGKTFVDLGSGVGNCCVQAALATGADSYGFENMAHASHLARLQLREAEERFTMWGLSAGKMECHESDFCESNLVPKVLKKADLVLVNNEVFTASLNDKLAYLFLDLPENCFLVSLKPFLPPSFKLSSHNSNHPLAYLSQTREMYKPGSVSWKMEGGSYYIARVEREKLQRWVNRQQEKEDKRKKDREDKRSRRSESTVSQSQGMSRNSSRQ